MPRQALYWVDESRHVALPEGPRPDRAWWVPGDRDKPPTLPMTPRHAYNAVYLDVGHDYRFRGDGLHYSGVINGPHSCWILLEYDDAPPKARKRGRSR